MRHAFLIKAVIGLWAIMSVVRYEETATGALQESGLTEPEIRNKWKCFQDAKDPGPIQGIYPYASCFEQAALKYDVPLPLLLAVARGESDFDPRAKSVKDCYGIMQIQWPGTANDLGITRRRDLFDPCINIHAGARYLSWLLNRFKGDIYVTVAAYNYGPNAVTPDNVPEGARWYAAYIYRHLQTLLSSPFKQGGKVLVLRFTFYDQAVAFISYVKQRVRTVPLEIFRSRMYTYDVYITYKTPEEQKTYCRCLIKATGIKPLEGGQL